MTEVIDLAVIATLNAQLAGVLAALAFSTLALYLARSLPGPKHLHIGITGSVVSAFVLLLVVSINYSTVAGIPQAPQMHTLMALHTPSFGIAISLLLLAIAIATRLNEQLSVVRALLKLMIVGLAPAMTMCEMLLGGFSYFQSKCPSCGFFDRRDWYASPAMWGFGVMAAVIAASIVFMILPDGPAISAHAYALPAAFGLAVMVIDFGGHVTFSLTPLTAGPSDRGFIVGEVLAGVILTGFAGLSAHILRSAPPPKAHT